MTAFRLRAPFRLSVAGSQSVAGDVAAATVDNRPPVWDAPANPLTLEQGATLDIRPYASDPDGDALTFTLESGTLPSGVTFAGGVFTAAAGAAVGVSGDIVVGADDGVTETPPAEPGDLPLFGITSAVGGADLPFAFGHVFAKGDVPTGSYVTADIADWQATPTTYWPDGSLRHAIIAGRATCSANTLKSITLGTTTTAPSGTALTEANLASALPATTLVCGAETITLGSLVGTAAKHRTVCAGPVMSNWLYRKQLAGSDHLVAWFDVRLYKGGAVEIFPWIENGYLFVASPANDVRTYTLTIGGVQKFSQSIDIKHHTRIPLLTGAAHSYWTTDPQILPKHDTTYMMASKMVPNYGFGISETALAAMSTTYTPNWIGNVPVGMGEAGFHDHIGVLPGWQAAYLASGGDPRAYRSVICNGYGSGAWSASYRDESTNEPMLFSTYPDAAIEYNGTPTIPAGTGGENGTLDQAHQPSMDALPWMLTGRWFHLDQMLFWNARNYLYLNYQTREGAKGIVFDVQVRGRAWHLRTMAQLLALLPSDHASFASLKASWESNTDGYEARYVTGTRDSGVWQNSIGTLGFYSGSYYGAPYGDAGNYWWDANWMQDFMAGAWGYAWDLDPPQSTASKASHLAVRNHAYKHTVGSCGDGSAGTFWFRHTPYKLPYGVGAAGAADEVAIFTDWGQVYAAYMEYGAPDWQPLAELAPGADIYYTDGKNFAETSIALSVWWSQFSGLCTHYAALSMAKEHGAAGADAAYARVTGASNFSLAAAGFQDTPVWGITPRAA